MNAILRMHTVSLRSTSALASSATSLIMRNAHSRIPPSVRARCPLHWRRQYNAQARARRSASGADSDVLYDANTPCNVVRTGRGAAASGPRAGGQSNSEHCGTPSTDWDVPMGISPSTWVSKLGCLTVCGQHPGPYWLAA